AADARLRRDQLLAEALRVRVDVRPAPEGSALDAEFRQALARPKFALARNGQPHRVEVVGVAPLFYETFARVLAEACDLQGIARLLAHALGEPCAVAYLLLDVELDALQLVAARKVAEHRVALPDRPRAIACDEAGRDVNQPGPTHALGDGVD